MSLKSATRLQVKSRGLDHSDFWALDALLREDPTNHLITHTSGSSQHGWSLTLRSHDPQAVLSMASSQLQILLAPRAITAPKE